MKVSRLGPRQPGARQRHQKDQPERKPDRSSSTQDDQRRRPEQIELLLDAERPRVPEIPVPLGKIVNPTERAGVKQILWSYLNPMRQRKDRDDCNQRVVGGEDSEHATDVKA